LLDSGDQNFPDVTRGRARLAFREEEKEEEMVAVVLALAVMS
jgi:hypothetical protein